MANIYRDADQVWVGELTREAQKGFQLFRELTDRMEDEHFSKFLEAYLRDGSNGDYWVALVELLDCPYWIRLWIFQEVFVSPHVSLCFRQHPKDTMRLRELFEWDFVRFEVVSKWREHCGNYGQGSREDVEIGQCV